MTSMDLLYAIGEAKDAYVYDVKNHSAKKPPRLWLNVLVAVLILCSLATTALATVGFTRYDNPLQMLASFFGDQSLPSSGWQMVEETHCGETYVFDRPAIERVPLNEDVAQGLVAPYIAGVNKSISYGGYTLTVLAHQYDSATACGVIYYTLENPEGISGYQLQYDGSITWPGGGGASIQNCAGEDFLLTEETTDTTLSIAHYYTRFSADADKDLMVGLSPYKNGKRMNLEEQKAFEERCKPICLPMDDGGGMRAMTFGDGNIRLSPIALRINAAALEFLTPAHGGAPRADEIRNIVIRHTDGSEYTVMDAHVNNYAYACSSMNNEEIAFSLNRLVDVTAVERVIINGVDLTDACVMAPEQRYRSALHGQQAQEEAVLHPFDGTFRVSDTGSTLTYQAYTLTTEAFSYDTRTRTGVFRFRLEHPAGFDGCELQWLDRISFGDGSSLEANQFGHWRSDISRSSDTCLYLSYHFVKLEQATGSLKLYFRGSGADVLIDSATQDMLYYPLEDTNTTSKVLADGNMILSSTGLYIDYLALGSTGERPAKDLVIRFDDGSCYVAADASATPFAPQCLYLDTAILRDSTERVFRIAFYQLTDPEQVSSVLFDGVEYPVP